MQADHAYAELLLHFRSHALIDSAKNVLEWDGETMLPEGGVAHRGDQIAELAGLAHEKFIAPRALERLEELSSTDLARGTGDRATNLREWRRSTSRKCRLERKLVERTARLTSVAQHAWASARKADDFAAFLPHLEAVLQAKREEGAALAVDHETPWEALLQEFEPGMTAASIDSLFPPLARELRALLGRVRGAAVQPRSDVLRRRVEVGAQRRFAESVITRLGFDWRRGRLDTSAHPFSTHLGPDDTRITTRFYEEDLQEGLFGALHEAGHALYDQGLPVSAFGTPRGEAASYGVHESQSRLWENFVGRSPGFWRCLYDELRRTWPGTLDDVPEHDFVGAINAVEPGPNRVRADEVTYNLHVVVRTELERALLAGDLAARELPGAWNEAYLRELGVTPSSDAEGCLQDGHWSAGLFGYFPTYTFGNLMAAEFFAAAERATGDLEEAFCRGDFASLLSWLRANVHRHGKTFPAPALLERATGSVLGHRTLVDALTKKCALVYRF